MINSVQGSQHASLRSQSSGRRAFNRCRVHHVQKSTIKLAEGKVLKSDSRLSFFARTKPGRPPKPCCSGRGHQALLDPVPKRTCKNKGEYDFSTPNWRATEHGVSFPSPVFLSKRFGGMGSLCMIHKLSLCKRGDGIALQ